MSGANGDGSERRLLAAVLVGGASSRFGSDKATIDVEGRSLYAHVLHATEGVATLRALVDRSENRHTPPPGVVAFEDMTPGGGPLQAAVAVWTRFPGWDLLLLPCDLPRFTRGHAAMLGAPLALGVDARLPSVEGRSSPLPALYAAHVAARFEEHLLGGGRALRRVLDGFAIEAIDERALAGAGLDPLGFHDVDTPADQARLLR